MKTGLKVLSLFDGLSVLQIAFKKLGLFHTYYSSEINKDAIFITQKNFPNTIQLGDIAQVRGKDLPHIDFLSAGFCCQSFSKLGQQLNFADPRGQLFFEAVRILNEVKPKWFLFENVVMKKEYQDIISGFLGVKPITINSSDFSCQSRKRLYWTNIPVKPVKDKGIFLKDIIYDDDFKVFTDPRITKTKVVHPTYVQWDMSGKGQKSLQDRAYFKDGKMGCLTESCTRKLKIVIDLDKDLYRYLHPVEAERCQTIPDHYTEGLSNKKRYGLIGNSFTVDVIKFILEGIL